MPKWDFLWFQGVCVGVMEQVQPAIASGTPPALTAGDTVKAVALIV
jgi:hypothetical protein